MVLTGFDGTPLQQGAEVLALKDVLLACLGRFVTQDGKQAIAAYAIGCKMHGDTGDTLKLEDAEFHVVKAAVGQNGPQFTSVVMGQVHGLLDAVLPDEDVVT